jgi:hypothetical protein
MTNPLAPNRIIAAERLDEVADILAAGMLRRHVRQVRAARETEFVPETGMGIREI